MREKTARALMRTKDVRRSAFLWNLVSACLNSFQTMVLLFVLTHRGNSTDSGILVMAYAAGKCSAIGSMCAPGSVRLP